MHGKQQQHQPGRMVASVLKQVQKGGPRASYGIWLNERGSGAVSTTSIGAGSLKNGIRLRSSGAMMITRFFYYMVNQNT